MNTGLLNSSRSLQYYVIARRWLSDMEFFKVESGFLQRLLDRHISRLQNQPQVGNLIAAGKHLQELEQMVDSDLLSRQLTQLELMAEDVIPEDVEALSEVQIQLEQLMSKLTRRFRDVKQEVYMLVLDLPQTNLT